MLRDRALDLMPVEGAVSRVSERLEARDLVRLCGIWRISLHRAQNSLLDRSRLTSGRPRYSYGEVLSRYSDLAGAGIAVARVAM